MLTRCSGSPGEPGRVLLMESAAASGNFIAVIRDCPGCEACRCGTCGSRNDVAYCDDCGRMLPRPHRDKADP